MGVPNSISEEKKMVYFCMDYRKVNDVTRKDAYPIPRVDDTLDTLVGSTWFTTLDLKIWVLASGGGC